MQELAPIAQIERGGTLRNRLRRETAERHRRAEAAMPSLAALGNREVYRATLARLYLFYSRWELATQHCEMLREVVPDLAERRRLNLLELDIRALGGSPRGSPLSGCDVLTVPQALGALYVLEGSTLGGQIIRRAVAPALGTKALAFFTGHGARTGALWSSFVAALDRYDGDADAVVAGADDCFADFERTLDSSVT